jgi:2-polyprenyl-3-methyl-5-hydroxy-6-metoxy-1,4-benzoquinol methylase
MRRHKTLSAGYFEGIYAANPDPWDFAGSAYELSKYDATLAALPKEHYRNVFEVGCSIGVFTRLLTGRCTRILAVDVAEEPLKLAGQRCAGLNVRFERRFIPREWPNERFDLIVLSEVLYYFDKADLTRIARLCAESLQPQGYAVLVHWTGETDYPLTGDAAAEIFGTVVHGAFEPVRQSRTSKYRLDVLARCEGPITQTEFSPSQSRRGAPGDAAVAETASD